MLVAARRLPAVVAAALVAITLATLLATTPASPRYETAAARAARIDRGEPRVWLVDRGRGEIVFGVESLRTRRRGELVRFADRVGPGQVVHCGRLTAHVATLAADRTLTWRSKVHLDVTRCGRDPDRRGGTLVQASARSLRPGQYVVLAGSVQAPPVASPGRLTHAGAVSQHRYRGHFSGSVAAPLAPPPAPPPPPPPPSGVPPSPQPESGSPRSTGPQSTGAPRRTDTGRSSDDTRTGTLLGGLLVFMLGATGVTAGLRRRGR